MFFSNNPRWVCLLLFSALTLTFTPGCTKKSKIESHLKRADGYFEAKDFKKAEIEYLNVRKLDPANIKAVKRLASIYYDQGNFKDAYVYLLGTRQLDPNDLENRIKLAQIFLSGGALPKTREEAVYVLDRDPKNETAVALLADSSVTPEDIADAHERLQKVEPEAAGHAAWHLAMAALALRQADMGAAEAALGKALSVEPQSGQVHLAWALFYWKQKDLKKADEFFQKASELGPLNAAICMRWAEFKMTSGSLKEGKEILQKFTEKVPDSVPVLLSLAKVEFDDRKYPECSKIVARVLALDSANFQARVIHADLTRVQGKPADSVKEFEELQRVYKDSAEVHFGAALAHLSNQDTAKAGLALQEALKLNPEFAQAAVIQAELLLRKGDVPAAVGLLKDVVQKRPGITRAQMLLASAYTGQGRLDEALSIYRALEQKSPDAPDLPFAIGTILRRQPNRNAEARKAFERAAALSPDDPNVVYQLVDLDVLDKNFPAAFERVQNLLAKKPQLSSAKIIEAQIFRAQNNLDKAEESLKQAIEWDPNSGTAYNLLTEIYLTSKKMPEALANLEERLKKNPKDVGVLFQKANIIEKQGDIPQATVAYRDLLKVAPDSAAALNNLAVILADKADKRDEAYTLAAKARELVPQDPSIADTLGWIQFRRQKYPEALALLQESSGKLPGVAEAQYHLAMASYMMGQEEAARLAFQRALEGKQEYLGRDEAQKRLAVLELDPETADASAVENLDAIVHEHPNDLPALLRLGRIYERTGAPEKARQAYEDAKKSNPTSAPALFQLARLYSTSLKNPQQALKLAKEARKLAPEDAEIGYLLGRLVDQSGDHQYASDLLQESARKLPGNPEVLFDLAQVYFAIGRVNDAGETMRRAVKLASDAKASRGLRPELGAEAQRFLELIGLYESPEKRLEAEAKVQEWLKEKPDSLPTQMVAGLIHEQRNRVQEAKQAYEKILAGNSQFALAKKQLAGLYTDQLGDQQKALELAKQAREVLTDDADLAKTLGKIAYRRGDFPNAITFLEESSAKHSEDAEVFYFLGMAQYQQKAKEESKSALDRAMSLSPNAAFAPEVKKVLAELEK
jgi:tetratricopeptide (TPR) repeat protein